MALKNYEAACIRVEDVWSEHDAKNLKLDILSSLTTTHLELGDYTKVHFYADLITRHESHSFPWLYKNTRDKESLAYTAKAMYIAHYSKAFVYLKLGKKDAAMKNFECALMCDAGCAATYYQLETLKREKAVREARRRAEEDRLQIIKRREEKKARKKLAKKLAKETKRRERMARGVGYVVGLSRG